MTEYIMDYTEDKKLQKLLSTADTELCKKKGDKQLRYSCSYKKK